MGPKSKKKDEEKLSKKTMRQYLADYKRRKQHTLTLTQAFAGNQRRKPFGQKACRDERKHRERVQKERQKMAEQFFQIWGAPKREEMRENGECDSQTNVPTKVQGKQNGKVQKGGPTAKEVRQEHKFTLCQVFKRESRQHMKILVRNAQKKNKNKREIGNKRGNISPTMCVEEWDESVWEEIEKSVKQYL